MQLIVCYKDDVSQVVGSQEASLTSYGNIVVLQTSRTMLLACHWRGISIFHKYKKMCNKYELACHSDCVFADDVMFYTHSPHY